MLLYHNTTKSMLFSATIFALVLGTAVSAPWYPGQYPGSSRHQMGLNPLYQGRSSLTQGFLCDWCVVGVGDAQAAVSENLDQIFSVLNRTAALCEYCPVADQCNDFIMNEIPLAIEDFLSESPSDLCNEAGVCDENATLPGMVMNNLNGNVARDRVIKQMLRRARVMQQKMIRLILGPDFLCTACQDFMTTSREMLLDNETQYEVMEFLAPLCDYMPSEYQTQCTEFVQSLPALMSMLATEVLTDATCTELGFCNTGTATEVPDIFSQFGLDRILPDIMNGQNPFQYPSGGSNRQNPFQFPGQNLFGSHSRPEQTPFGIPSRPGQTRPGQNPYGIPSRTGHTRPGQNPYGIPSRQGQTRPGQNPYGIPSRPGQTRPGQNPYGIPSRPGQTRPGMYPSQSRPQQPQSPIGKWPTNSRPSVVKPQKPKTTPKPVEEQIPDFNLEDFFGKNTGVLDRLPSLPDMPDLNLPRLPANIPGGRRNIPGRTRHNQGRRHGRRQRSVPEWTKLETVVPEDKVLEYLPGPIPDAGITITEQGTDENCEVCKMAVTAVDAWLQENAPELQKMISNAVTPFCQAFPSPMKEDCVSDVAEFVQTFIQTLVSKLQPEPICTWLRVCSAKEEEAILPTLDMGMEPTTWPLMP